MPECQCRRSFHRCWCPAMVDGNRRLLFQQTCPLWRACNVTSFSPCLTGPVDYPFASRHKGPRFKYPGGYFCETGILLLALSHYIGDPDEIDHCGLVWGGPRPEPSLGPRANNVIIPLDLTHLYCPGFTLAAGLLPASQPTESAVGGEPCGEPAISLGYLCETGSLPVSIVSLLHLHMKKIQYIYHKKTPYNWKPLKM
jgi:hypothetical protein